MNRAVLLFPLTCLFAVACDGDVPDVISADQQIDEVDPNMDPDSEGTRMCVNSEGHVYVIWMDNRLDMTGGKRDIWFQRSLERGEPGTWLPSPFKINVGDANKPGPGQVFNPEIACDDGGVYVVWEDDRDGFLENHQIYFNRSLDNGEPESWLPEDLQIDTMDPGGNTMSRGPQLKVVDTNVHIVWYDGFNGPFDIYYALSFDGGTSFNSPQNLDGIRGDSFSSNPRIEASLNEQDVWVVWEDSRDGKSDIYTNRSTNGGVTFRGPLRLDSGDMNGETNSFAPEICSDGGSNVYVVWHDERDSTQNRDIYYNFTGDAGENWFAAARRLDDGDADGFSNSLFPTCVSEGPIAHVVWQDYRSDNAFDIWYRQINNGNPAPEEARVDVGTEDAANIEGFANSVDAQIALANNRVGVAWLDFRGEANDDAPRGFGDIRYNFMEPGEMFQEEDLQVESWLSAGSFKSDVNFQMLGGELYAAWTDGRNPTLDIFFTRLEIGTEGVPPMIAAN